MLFTLTDAIAVVNKAKEGAIIVVYYNDKHYNKNRLDLYKRYFTGKENVICINIKGGQVFYKDKVYTLTCSIKGAISFNIIGDVEKYTAALAFIRNDYIAFLIYSNIKAWL
jgi:hypothetical protein